MSNYDPIVMVAAPTGLPATTPRLWGLAADLQVTHLPYALLS